MKNGAKILVCQKHARIFFLIHPSLRSISAFFCVPTSGTFLFPRKSATYLPIITCFTSLYALFYLAFDVFSMSNFKGGKAMKETVSIRFYLRKARTSKKGETPILARIKIAVVLQKTKPHDNAPPPEHDSFLNAFDIRTIRTSARRICPASVRSRSRSAATVRKRAANERQTGGESDASAALNAGDRSDVPAPTPVAVRAADTPSDARSGGFSGRNVGPSAPWAGNGAEGPWSTKPRGVR